MTDVRLPVPCLVVLIGPSGSGKSTWAAEQFQPDQIVSTDRLRAMVGLGEHDQRAGTDAFDVLDLVIERRMARGLVTVIDSLALDPDKRRRWREAAASHKVPVHAVVFDTPAATCRARNKARGEPVPSKVVTSQLKSFAEQQEQNVIANEGFAAVHERGQVRLLVPAMAAAGEHAQRQQDDPRVLAFGLQISSFNWSGGSAELGSKLAGIGRAAEEAGFESVWVMDHFLQIPQVGREWDPMLDSYTALGYLAAATETVRLGTLVTGITYRNIAHLGKIIATLDVLSGGRAVAGLGAAWHQREHTVYGWDFPTPFQRFALLEDALELFPLLWGPGSPPFKGRCIEIPEAICYPRPIQEHIPILIGGSGERRTLRLVAQYADACNLFGDANTVRHKVDILQRHCADVGRDPSEITVTQLSTVMVADTNPKSMPAEGVNPRVNAGTAEDHIGRFRQLAEAGVQTAIVNMPDLDDTTPLERFADVIAAFRE
jgi:F420-dependent oxidoreductase-like protein